VPRPKGCPRDSGIAFICQTSQTLAGAASLLVRGFAISQPLRCQRIRI
jgi:hypothetical protein